MSPFTLEDALRFMSKLRVGPVDACWPWRGAVKDNGYGNFSLGGRTESAHRVAYLLAFGDPGDAHVRHTCDFRPCGNPSHLIAGTRLENAQDMVRKGRSSRGSSRPKAFLSEGEVRAMLAARGEGAAIPELSATFHMSERGVRQILDGSRWGWIERA